MRFIAMKSSALMALVLVMGVQTPGGKKVLDHSVYDGWKSIRGTTLSNDGQWVAYAIAPQEGDMVLEVQNTKTKKKYAFPVGQSLTLPAGSPTAPRVSFSGDSKFLVATVLPKWEDYKKARKDKAKPEDQPKNALLIVDLESGKETMIPKVTSWQLAEEDKGFLLYRPEPAPAARPAAPAPASEKPAEVKATEVKPAGEAQEKKEEPKKEEVKKKNDHRPGDLYVLRRLSDAKETKLENVTSASFNKTGEVLAVAISDKDGKGDGIFVHTLATGQNVDVVKQLGRYPRMTLTDDGKQLAFLTDKDDYAAKTPNLSLYRFEVGPNRLKQIAKVGDSDLPKDFVIATGALAFSESGKRLRFAIAPKPQTPPEVNPDEAVALDVWHWQDGILQSQQLNQVATERNRSYEILVDLGSNKKVQLESPEFQNASVSNKFDHPYGLVSDNQKYRKSSSWGQSFTDYYVKDLRSGEQRPLVKKTEAGLSQTPDGKYAIGYEEESKQLVSYDLKSLDKKVLNKDLPPIWDELNDVPSPAGLIGFGGFTKEGGVLVYDAFDIWHVDLNGKSAPKNLTNGWGRTLKMRYRIVPLDRDADYVDLSKPLFLSAVDTRTLDSGFASLDEIGSKPKPILFESKSFGSVAGLRGQASNTVTKAKDADTVVYARQSVEEFPDLWVADNIKFENRAKITDANPQIKDYVWPTVEHVDYLSNDGDPLRGLLYKPNNFDASKKYPMIVYFYERDSEGLHLHRSPAPSASTINIPLFVSNGYIVLVTDIKYKTGYPGESAVNCILPATHEVLRKGFVDEKRVGIQGQSWGGYQVGYLVTETDMFAAGCAGAPVSNMLSAYGGIRGESGVVREGQYEGGQSRIGGSLWEYPLRYLENSPLIHADKIKTPLLIMANDKDGAVPWQQGIEFFTAMRRLEKACWMLNYNGEAHNLVERRNRKDFSIRLSQFFDHYLKGIAMPQWMEKGIPAVEKGSNMGLSSQKNPNK